MNTAAFKAIALFIWSRNRRSFVIWGSMYALLFIGSETLSMEQSRPYLGLATGFLLFSPLILPLACFTGSGMNAHSDLTSPAGLFPRLFFVVPAAAYQLVLPFMSYAALVAAAQWGLAAAISHGRLFDLATGRLWVPVLATSFIAWMQALVWTPARHRFVRTLQLVALLAVYAFVFVHSLDATSSRELTLALSLIQFPMAYAVAVHGVAKCRRGEPTATTAQDNGRQASTTATRLKRALALSPARPADPSRAPPQFRTAFEAQLWIERRIHPWAGKTALLALLAVVLWIILLMLAMSDTDGSHREALAPLSLATLYLLLFALGSLGISTGLQFGTFRSRMEWHQADAYWMPPYFAALPLATGDFAWAKLRAATQRMLWVSVGGLLICAALVKVSGLYDVWLAHHAGWLDRYGFAGTLALGALPSLSFVLLVLSGTANVIWIALLGRRSVVSSIVLTCVLLQVVFTVGWRPDPVASLLTVLIPIEAVVKLCALAALILYVGTRRMLSWRRVGMITAFWAVTAGSLTAWLTWYTPHGIGPMDAFSASVVVTPVLGALAAPAALGWNRVR